MVLREASTAGPRLVFAAGGKDSIGIDHQVLLEAGAGANDQNADGNTAWDYIYKNEALTGTSVYWELNQRRFE